MQEVKPTSFWTIDPSTQKPLKEYPYQSWLEILPKLELSKRAFRSHGFGSLLEERKKWVLQIARSLLEKRDEIAHLMSLEMGKPLKESRGEVEKCALLCEVFAAHSDEWLKEQVISNQYKVVRHPYGVVLGIMPWNFPFWQVFRYAIPALLSGNSVLLKHSDQVAGSAQLLEKIFQQSLPNANLFQCLFVDHQVAEQVIQSSFINMVSFTGSTTAGARVAGLCGQTLKKCVIELGGNDAYVVAASADLKHAAKICAAGRLVNNGQSCVSAKRFLIHRLVFSSFLKLFQAEIAQFKLGAPLEQGTDLGPLSAKRFYEQIQMQCRDLESKGYQKVYEHPGVKDSLGNYFAPRIYVGTSAADFYDEEIFGPVAVCYSYESWEEVEHFITGSQYGLGSAFFSQDQNEKDRFIRCSEAGFVSLNESVKSSPVAPFGGFKNSGFGRELGQAGFLEFTQTKTIFGEGFSVS